MFTIEEQANEETEMKQVTSGSAYDLLHASFLLGFLLDPEDGDDMFLRKVG
jgi:hypothetical protein